MIKKSILASLLISLGVAVNLTLGPPLGPILFAFGLLCVCNLSANLFTGKAGYFEYSLSSFIWLFKILIINVISGWLIGFLLSYSSPQLIEQALIKSASWDFSINFFISAVFCGVIMYLCVELYKRGILMGIFYGIPLFIFCGFQHCVANVITLGIAHSWSNTVWIAAVGNFIGSIAASYLVKENNNEKNN